MEISKENIFKKNYTSAFKEEKVIKKKRTSLINFIKKNKIISFTMFIFLLASCFNFILVYNFIIILEKIR